MNKFLLFKSKSIHLNKYSLPKKQNDKINNHKKYLKSYHEQRYS